MNEPNPATRNPFAPPQASLEPIAPASAGAAPLASRWERLGGALIDGLLAGVALVPASVSLGFAQVRVANEPWTMAVEAGAMGIVSLLLLASLLALQWTLLARRGQSVGKIVAGIRIVRADGSHAGFWRAVALRNWPVLAVGWMPEPWPLLGFIDILAIFGSERRCLHDFVADTKVIKAAGA